MTTHWFIRVVRPRPLTHQQNAQIRSCSFDNKRMPTFWMSFLLVWRYLKENKVCLVSISKEYITGNKNLRSLNENEWSFRGQPYNFNWKLIPINPFLRWYIIFLWIKCGKGYWWVLLWVSFIEIQGYLL